MNILSHSKGPRIGDGLQASPGLLRRHCSCGHHTGGGKCAECRKDKQSLQRRRSNGPGANAVPPSVHAVLRSPGQPLEPATRAFMEPRFGHDFSQVRLHTDARAAESARSVNALAYTVGPDIVFATGQYAPGTAHGNRLLAHELTHVVQQGAKSATGPLEIGHTNDPHEQEADKVASAMEERGSERPRLGRVAPGPVRLQRLGANPNCTKQEINKIHQAIFDARGWLNKAIPKLEESQLKPAVLAALRRNFGPTYGVAENASLISGRLKVARVALGRIPFSCDSAETPKCQGACGWAAFGSNAAAICTNPKDVNTLSHPSPFPAYCVLHESLHAAMSFMTADVYENSPGYPGVGTQPLLNADSYTHLAMDLS
ncbi:MAG TPA: DUF4157 domain-containing protein [Thermoanaerobaculia bacterium]|nr:DUF4157 domain-containing protein [Thermoanaerobaculia bacterium]